LINITARGFGLVEKIRKKTTAECNFVNAGINGDTITGMRQRLGPILQMVSGRRTMLILFWDTDIEDRNAGSTSLQKSYEQNLTRVITSITEAGHTAVISSPGLMPDPSKSGVLDEYKEINRRVAESLKCIFLDMRSPMLESLASGKVPTVDGQHLSETGAEIAAGLFAQAIDVWLRKTRDTNADCG
jgi:lysophospholipase L1-like esterase